MLLYHFFAILFLIILYRVFVRVKSSDKHLNEAIASYTEIKDKIDKAKSRKELEEIELMDFDSHHQRFTGKIKHELLNQQLCNLSIFADQRALRKPFLMK